MDDLESEKSLRKVRYQLKKDKGIVYQVIVLQMQKL